MSNLRVCPRCGGSGKVIDNHAVGADMRKEREHAGLSLRAVAKRLKLSAAYVSDLELGRRAWTAARVRSYAKIIAMHDAFTKMGE